MRRTVFGSNRLTVVFQGAEPGSAQKSNRKMEALMSFGIQGPKGDTGPQGPRGATGPQGPAGASSSGMGLLGAAIALGNSGDGTSLPITLYSGPMRKVIVLTHSPIGGGGIIISQFPPSNWYVPAIKFSSATIIQTEWITSGSYTFLIFG